MASTIAQIPYEPLPKQAQAHALEAKYRGFCGGWGNGKTSWGCVETLALLLQYPNTNCIIARKTRPELKSTTWEMFMYGDASQDGGWHGIPKEVIRYHNKSDLILEFKNGCKVYGLPLDDPKKIENYNLGLFWIDQAEEVEEDIFLKFQGRLRQHHSPREGLLTFNPAGHNWLWRRFIDPDRKPNWRKLYRCIEATTFDNPNLPADYFEQFEGLPEHWIQRFVMGSHEVFTGQIFTDWSADVHVIEPFLIPPHWERWMCMDPGIRHEAAATWVARDPDGNCFYYREHLEANRDVDWWTAKIFEMENESDVGGPEEEVYRRLIGPEAEQRAQTDGKTVLGLFLENGLPFEKAERDPSARISIITSYLRPRSGHNHPLNGADPSPRLFVFSSCDKLKEYLPQYRWKPQRSNFSEEDSPEKPRKRDDHNIDNLGHILLALDGLPPVDDSERGLSPSERERRDLDEHFDRALEDAKQYAAVGGHDVLGGSY
jgi:terminase large subunit-like protein